MEHSPKTKYWMSYLNNPETGEKTVARLTQKYGLHTIGGQIAEKFLVGNRSIVSLILTIAGRAGEEAAADLCALQALGLPLDLLNDENEGVTALHLAAADRNQLACERLMNAGVDINTPSAAADTPFDWAARTIVANRNAAVNPVKNPDDLSFLRFLAHHGATVRFDEDLWDTARAKNDFDLLGVMYNLTGPACKPAALQQCNDLSGALARGRFAPAAGNSMGQPVSDITATLPGEATAPKHFGWEQTALQNQQ